MIIIMNADVDPNGEEVATIEKMVARLPGVTSKKQVVQGEWRTLVELHLVGQLEGVSSDLFSSLPFVGQVVEVKQRYRRIGRHRTAESFTFEHNGVTFGDGSLQIFAGLCAVDDRSNVEASFRALHSLGLHTTRMGVYKPRTSPYDFQGLGAACLPYVFELAGKYDIKLIAMEVLGEGHIDEIRSALEASGRATAVMLQVGTRNAQNFELLKAVGGADMPVLYKRGMGITLEESLNACEYIAACGNPNIVFCLRGMKTQLGDPHRNLVDFAHVPVVKRLTRLPVCVDPSHAVGRLDLSPDGVSDIAHVTAQGVIAGADMVLADIHPDPARALCDGPQALSLEELERFVEDLAIARDAYRRRCALYAAAR